LRGLLISILSVFTAVVIIHPFNWSLPLFSSLFLFLNFIIVLSAAYFRFIGIIIFGLYGLLVALLSSFTFTGSLYYSVFLLLASVLTCYAYNLQIERLARRDITELDNIEEEKNVLAAELEHLRLDGLSLKQKLHRYAALKDLTQSLSLASSLNELNSLVVRESFRIIGKSSAAIFYLVNQQNQELGFAAKMLADSSAEAHPLAEQKVWSGLKKGDIFDNWVFKQHSRLMIRDAKKDFRFNIQDIESKNVRSIRSLISVPLISKNKLIGILRLDNTSKEAYDSDDLRLLDVISDLSAVAMEKTLLYEQTEKLAITDGLTGLFVHRYFQQRFDEEASRALWTNSQFAFLMLDIDNFKGYNDTYGHISGDIVLKEIARLISLSVNPGDIVARYGGEEFALLLVNTTRPEALKLAEKIRERIADEKFILRRQLTRVNISGGMAFFPEDDRTKEGLIKKADQALYQAKLEGKNRICIL
jgi:diguanylate cyclase (GGDEF)-like protein